MGSYYDVIIVGSGMAGVEGALESVHDSLTNAWLRD